MIKIIVEKINVLELEFEVLSNEGLIEKIVEYKVCVEGGESFDVILFEVFVNCCEVVKWVFGLWVFDM